MRWVRGRRLFTDSDCGGEIMAAKNRSKKPGLVLDGISRIAVSGFKSIAEEQSIEVRPLTILAGANSSGKSSIMQPLLLLKQTLEASYDPGALLLDGPNLKFTSYDQFLSRTGKGPRSDELHLTLGVGPHLVLRINFRKVPEKGLDVSEMSFSSTKGKISLRSGMTHDEIVSVLPPPWNDVLEKVEQDSKRRLEWVIERERCFLVLRATETGKRKRVMFYPSWPTSIFEPHVRNVIHLPGLRGNPERTYPLSGIGSSFPGTFQSYTASVIAGWRKDKNKKKLDMLGEDLEKLGLTWKVRANPIDDTRVELKVGRLPHPLRAGAQDLVSIADVGFGVSQSLPVLVALHVAERGQLVYLEQPEIHLHPRAQGAMAEVLADAAIRGVRVVVETHSVLLIRAIQSLVAEDRLASEKVKLHWFERRHSDGCTQIKSADLDKAGAFGDWPQDFGEVELMAENRYLDAAQSTGRQA